MPWFKVDDGFHSHPKVIDLSLEAIGAWTLAGAWCAQYLTDGHITPRQLAKAGGDPSHAAELVGAGLWHETEAGWQFANWNEYQPTKESVESKREAEAVGAARGNHARWHVGRGVTSPDCEFCQKESGKHSTPDSGTRSGTRSSPESGKGESSRPGPSRPDPYSPDADATDQSFEQWWKHYPKKVDKGQARKAFKTALSKTDIATLTAGVTRYAQSVASTEARYIKNPATWLNAEAWDNQPDPEPERPKSAWDYGPEAYMHPEEIEYERRAAAGGN